VDGAKECKKLFALGNQSRAELVRHKSASETGISRDGQWVAYVSYPDLMLWRCEVDGTERQQLTFPPMQVAGPDSRQMDLTFLSRM